MQFVIIDTLNSSIWNKSYNLAIIVVLQIAPRPQTKLVEASQHHCVSNTMLAVPKFHASTIQCHLLYLLWVFGGSDQVMAALASKGEQLCSSTSSEEDGGLFGSFCFLLTVFLLLLKGTMLHLRMCTFALDSALHQLSYENIHLQVTN